MEILYSDKEIAVCLKPLGVDSEKELPALLVEALGGQIFPVHRLDKNVGGCMVYARTKQAAAAFSKAIQEGAMVKEYGPGRGAARHGRSSVCPEQRAG